MGYAAALEVENAAMEFLLLVSMAGALAWVWNRMEALERRVAGLEGSALVPAYTRSAELEVPHPTADTAGWDSWPEHAGEASVLHPAESDFAPAPADFDPAEEPVATQSTFVATERGFRPSFDFEEIFGRQLPIWGGGIALAIAGLFLVRWSIEMGMLTRAFRVTMGFAFGTLLLGAAELAYRFEHRISDERVRQALAGAGLATLYASFYLAGTHYGLIGPAVAFAGLAGVTALALVLSFRFGLPSAVLGLVGGFAAPALAGSPEPNLPMLAAYLALVTGGLTVTGRRQQRPWLGFAALVGGLGWGALMLVAGPLDHAGILAIGGYLVVVGTLLPSMMGTGPLGTAGRIAAAGLATLQIAALVDESGYSLLAWGCYLLLGAAIAALGFKFVRLREAGALAAALSACLLATWPAAPGGWFAAIAAANALIFAGVPLFHAWRGEAGPIDWAQLALYPIALVVAACVQLEQPLIGAEEMPVALGALALAILPALAAWRVWPSSERDFPVVGFAVFASAVVLAVLAGLLAVSQGSAPLVTAAVAVPVFLLLRGRAGTMPRALKWSIAMAGTVLLFSTSHWQEANRLFGEGDATAQTLYAIRWLAAALPCGLLLVGEPNTASRRLGEILGALLGYGTIAMVVPGDWLAWTIAATALILAWRMPQRGVTLATLLVLGALWSLGPLLKWATAGIAATAGAPFLLDALPALADTLRYAAPLAVAVLGALLLSDTAVSRHRLAGWLAASALTAVIAHVAFKQVFAIDDMIRFAELGLGERTAWQGLLALIGVGLATLVTKPFAALSGQVIATVALAHFVLFSLFLHNPLWAEQSVGSWPIANLLLVSYGLAIGLTVWLRRQVAGSLEELRPAFDAVAMTLIALLALSELRQVFAGTVLLGPVGSQEDLLRSILAIAVALGFLAWGAVSGQRSWRIGSLVLMILAVLKVFILDAAGLEGLARIGSFFALGVCLIGIGWFYSRQLVRKPAEAD